MSSLRVLHVVARALERSETFIQRQLVGERYAPSVLSWARVQGGLEVPCPVSVINDGRHGLGAFSQRTAFALRHFDTLRRLHAARPDVVHAHFGPVGCSIDRHCRLLSLPLVVSFYGFDVGTTSDVRALGGYRRLFTHGATLTAEGPVLAQRLITLGASPHHVKLLPLCLPDSATRVPERRIDWQAQPLRLLQIARFVEKKGIDTSLHALALARKRGVDATLELVGDGPLRAELQTLCQELELGSAVRFCGFVRVEQLTELYAQAHALLQPSRTARDGDTEGGYPTTVIEAQAAGLPVIASRHADIPFVVKAGQSGWLAAEGAPAEAFASLIVEADTNRQELSARGTRARRNALHRHAPKRHLMLRERIYREARRAHAARHGVVSSSSRR